MTIKTITVTETAYKTLKLRKEKEESFSDAIMRLAGRKPLEDFFGALGKESADSLEKAVMGARKSHRKPHLERMKRIAKEMG